MNNEMIKKFEPLKGSPAEAFREAFLLHLADNSLIMGHRLSEWAGHGPMLEQDIALTNIALDLIGQSRNFYQYAAELINVSSKISSKEVTEDTLAYLRSSDEFKNILLVELPNGDWAKTIAKLFLFSVYQYLLYERLLHSADKQISAIAEKSLKEVTYHVRWSSEWIIRLGDGTVESHSRLQKAVDELWNYTNEMFLPVDYDMWSTKNNIGIDVSLLRDSWYEKVKDVFEEATIFLPNTENENITTGGKQGKHTKHLNAILNEMQFLQRTYPSCKW
jgi:ring-1,2-phenylacetyl-CoA epoxidase subunit PaaC